MDQDDYAPARHLYHRGSLRRQPVHWYRVRGGSGSAANGDRINIYGTGDADTLSPAAPYARLKLSGDGFTGIKVNRYPGGERRYLEVKDYTGQVENPSPEGRRDIEMIGKTCRS
jgi:hypothetical protein